MSTFILLLISYGLLSLFCTAVLVAACMVAGRAQRLRTYSKFHPTQQRPAQAESPVKPAAEVLPRRRFGFPKSIPNVFKA